MKIWEQIYHKSFEPEGPLFQIVAQILDTDELRNLCLCCE